VAVQALLSGHDDPMLRPAIEEGLGWLTAAVVQKRHRQPAPIGFYFAKLWYHERLYPLTFTVAALGQAIRQLAPGLKPAPASPPPGNTETAG
jgi:hypothetical protein